MHIPLLFLFENHICKWYSFSLQRANALLLPQHELYIICVEKWYRSLQLQLNYLVASQTQQKNRQIELKVSRRAHCLPRLYGVASIGLERLVSCTHFPSCDFQVESSITDLETRCECFNILECFYFDSLLQLFKTVLGKFTARRKEGWIGTPNAIIT